MKRLWIGIGLLAAMLVSGILIPEIMESCHSPIVEDLQRAAELAMDSEWERAEFLAHRAEEKWEEKRPVTAVFTDHEPMDDIDGMFDQVEIYAEARDAVSFGSTCAYLASRLDALGDYHDLSFPNLF